MFSLKPLLVGLSLAALSSSAIALTTSEQTDYDRLISGDINQIKQAAQSIVSSNNSNPEVLDVLAQYLAKNYLVAADYQLDTMAWACRALGETGNARYRDLLSTIVNSDAHKKIRKYAKKSLKRLPSDSTEQFITGSVDLSNLKKMPLSRTFPRLKVMIKSCLI
ncbi:HEAT repeat domain-containing protein [Pseudoalteromonas agarivorans]|uniref:HEAT repeat domain-containing protein n=1 Tax=Pseudoalteromonas agarivorans TaxID=176102 RepID=UPI00311E103D